MHFCKKNWSDSVSFAESFPSILHHNFFSLISLSVGEYRKWPLSKSILFPRLGPSDINWFSSKLVERTVHFRKWVSITATFSLLNLISIAFFTDSAAGHIYILLRRRPHEVASQYRTYIIEGGLIKTGVDFINHVCCIVIIVYIFKQILRNRLKTHRKINECSRRQSVVRVVRVVFIVSTPHS